jgi:hypothetical protein
MSVYEALSLVISFSVMIVSLISLVVAIVKHYKR